MLYAQIIMLIRLRRKSMPPTCHPIVGDEEKKSARRKSPDALNLISQFLFILSNRRSAPSVRVRADDIYYTLSIQPMITDWFWKPEAAAKHFPAVGFVDSSR